MVDGLAFGQGIKRRENYSHGTLLDFYYSRGTLHLLV